MRKVLKNSIDNYHMPFYMQEILVKNYCPYFLRMSIVRDGEERWMFNYETDNYTKINLEALDCLDKLTLIQTMIKLSDRCEEWLIKAEKYLIEPELIYCEKNAVKIDRVRLMFYPDSNNDNFDAKMIRFIERLKNRQNRNEYELLEQIITSIKNGEGVKTRQLIEKNIMRIKIDEQYKAS